MKKSFAVERSLKERREIIGKLEQVQTLLFAIAKGQGRIRVLKTDFDNLEGANVQMRDEGEFWIVDFVPPGVEKPEGAA